ncbi:hypothetical protein JKY72_06295 [Candidatus Gracilibacteria bacterium]|nr:hypothetical protein [Candidatus Gracilibacteria bacterium]
MALEAQYEFLFIGKDDNSFLEAYSYDLFQEHGDKSGQIFINLEIQNNPVDSEEIAQVVYETMQKVFFEDVGRDTYERFEVALKAVNGVLASFKEQKTSGYIGNLNIVIAAIVGGDVYLSQCGDAEAYLIRKKYISVISDGLSDEDEGGDIFTSIANGNIEKGDFVLFSTTRLLRYISKTDLAKLITPALAQSLDDVRDAISTEILGRVGLTGISFESVSDKKVEVEEGAKQSVLEASAEGTSAKKETISGKFFTKFKKDKTEVFQGGGSSLFSKVVEGFSGFFEMMFAKGSSKNKILGALIIVIIVLSLGIAFSKSRIAEREEISRLDEVLVSVEDRLKEADTKGSYDKEAAKSILDRAYSDALSVLNAGLHRDKARTLLIRIEETRDSLDNVERIENPTVLADLSVKNPSISALGFANVSDRLYVYDTNGLYEVVLDQVQDALTIDDDETVIAATGFDDRNSLVFLTKSGKLIEYRNGTMNFMDTDDGSFHKAVAIADWGSRIYLMDNVAGQIWKYAYKGTRDKFGSAEAYLLADDEVDVSSAVDFDIDSSLYVLDNSGDVWRFYGGAKQEFFINDAPFNAFKDPSVIFTNEKLDQVFVLDSKEARVLVFNKNTQTGNLDYSAQYMFDGVGEIRDIYVEADDRKLLVLTENKVIEVGL